MSKEFEPTIFISYRNLARAILNQWTRDIFCENRRLKEAEKELSEISLKNREYIKVKKKLTWAKINLQELEEWQGSKWAEFYSDIATIELKNKSDSMGEKLC